MKRALLAAVLAALMTGSAIGADKPVKIGYSDWPGWTAWQIAKEKKLFEKNGANVELVWFPVYTDSLNALNAGQVDANCQTWNDTLVPLAQGLKQVAVLVNDNSAGNDGIVAKAGITSVKDLKGKKVATELGTVDHFLLMIALSRAGLTEKDITFVPMPVPDAAAAFIKGSVDACVVWQPSLDLAIKEGKGTVIYSSKDTPGLIPDMLVFQEKVIKERPADVQAIVKTWFDVYDFLQKNKEEGVAIMAKLVGVEPASYMAFLGGTAFFGLPENLKAFEKRADDHSLYGSGDTISKFLIEQKVIEKAPDHAAALDASFVKKLQP